MTRDVRKLSPGGHFLGYCSHHEASEAIRFGRAKIRDATRKRLRAIEIRDARVADRIPGAALQTYYREQLGDTLSVGAQRRLTADGRLIMWDQRLTFREIREGKLASARADFDSATERQRACA